MTPEQEAHMRHVRHIVLAATRVDAVNAESNFQRFATSSMVMHFNSIWPDDPLTPTTAAREADRKARAGESEDVAS